MSHLAMFTMEPPPVAAMCGTARLLARKMAVMEMESWYCQALKQHVAGEKWSEAGRRAVHGQGCGEGRERAGRGEHARGLGGSATPHAS